MDSAFGGNHWTEIGPRSKRASAINLYIDALII